MTVCPLYLYNVAIFLRDNLNKYTSKGALNTGDITTIERSYLDVPRHITALLETDQVSFRKDRQGKRKVQT